MSRLKASAVILMCVTVGSYLGKLHFIFELASHFRVHFALLFLLLLSWFSLRREAKWAVLSLAALSASLFEIVPWYLPSDDPRASTGAESIEVVVSNVRYQNRDYARMLRFLAEVQPDVLGLMEVDATWLDNLASLDAEYAYRFQNPRDDLFGLMLFSRLPLRDARIVRFGSTATPSIVATIDKDGVEFEFILAHAPWPLGSTSSARRNRQLKEMARYIGSSGRPIVLGADLNTTVWSHYYREFEQLSGMSNARAGHGIGATFPPLTLLGIGIDHILVTPPLTVGDFRVHERIGSDHLPISARISMAPRH